ncbi:MAG: phage holin family protein [Deltaproteobacteria bacterium]|nr:phage holin family protein [Deltaproteobacteria bacterium]
MRTILIRLLTLTSGILIVAHVFPGIEVDGARPALLAAAALGLLNVSIKPVLFLLSLPLTILTLGLFMLVINAAMLLAAAYLIEGFRVNGFFPALGGAAVISVIGVFVRMFTEE